MNEVRITGLEEILARLRAVDPESRVDERRLLCHG